MPYKLVIDGYVSGVFRSRNEAEARGDRLAKGNYAVREVEASDFGRSIVGPYAIVPAGTGGRFHVLVDNLGCMAERLEDVKARIRAERQVDEVVQHYGWHEVCRFVNEASQMC
jgi:hypothetical protein